MIMFLVIVFAIVVFMIMMNYKLKEEKVKAEYEAKKKEFETQEVETKPVKRYVSTGSIRQQYFDLRLDELIQAKFPNIVHWEYDKTAAIKQNCYSSEIRILLFEESGKCIVKNFFPRDVWGDKSEEMKKAPEKKPQKNPAQIWIEQNAGMIEGKVRKAKNKGYLQTEVKFQGDDKLKIAIAKELTKNTSYYVTSSKESLIIDFRGSVEPDEVPEDFPA